MDEEKILLKNICKEIFLKNKMNTPILQVARLLMDTSVLQFYPTLFVLATDVMDMLGDMVWKRIKQKAEFSEDGNVICSLPGFISFISSDLSMSLICVCACAYCFHFILCMLAKRLK